jgi:CSLREA domain-containing protein
MHIDADSLGLGEMVMIRLSSRLLLVLVWVFSIGFIHAARPQPTQSFGAAPPLRPTTNISVTTHGDDFALNDTCSLREAVYAAVHDTATDACAAGAGNDLITLPAATYVLTRTGTAEEGGLTGDLDITGTLRITGATSATTIIDGNQTDRILDIFSGAVTLDNLTLRNGMGQIEGGAIRLRSGALNVDQSGFEHNKVNSGGTTATFGGAIANLAGNAMVTRSVFAANHAYGEYLYVSSSGGVLYNGLNASSTIIDSLIQDTVHEYLGETIQNKGYLVVRGTSFLRNPAPIVNSGTALIESSRFLSNTFTPVKNMSQVTINDSEFAFNSTPIQDFDCLEGGAILNHGQASINRTSIHHNQMQYGGGIASFGRTDIRDSSIVHNRSPNDSSRGREYCAGLGGGIYAHSGTLTVENSTIAYNWAGYTGGGIDIETATTTITNTTIVDNYSDMCHVFWGCAWPTADAGGIYAYVPITLTNTLIAHNTSRVSPAGSDCAGSLVGANNLILAPSPGCTVTATASLIGVAPLLGPLADHGGATLAYNLLPGSPAIDAGSPGGCPDHDQRGVFRPQDGDASGGPRCDIGAYEYVYSEIAITATPTATPTTTAIPTVMPTATPSSTATATAAPPLTSTSTATAAPPLTSTSTATAQLASTPSATAPANGTPTATAAATTTATPAATSTVVATPPAGSHAVYLPYLRR